MTSNIDAPAYPVLSAGSAREQAALFKMFADPVRLHIIAELGQYGGKINNLRLSVQTGIYPSVLQHHLAVLRRAGFLTCEKRGTDSYYYVNPERIETALDVLGALKPRVWMRKEEH